MSTVQNRFEMEMVASMDHQRERSIAFCIQRFVEFSIMDSDHLSFEKNVASRVINAMISIRGPSSAYSCLEAL